MTILSLSMSLAGSLAFATIQDIDGVFFEPEPVKIMFDAEAYRGPLEVVYAAPPGPVCRGDILLELDRSDIEDRLREGALDLSLRRLAFEFRLARAESLDESTSLDLWQARLALDDAEARLERVRSIEIPQSRQRSEDRLSSWDEQRDAQVKMHEILVAMYEEDGAIETNERLDMEASKRRLERGANRYPDIVANHEILRDQTLPRQLAQAELQVRRAALAYETAKMNAEIRRIEFELESDRERRAIAKDEGDLEKLTRDLEAHTLRATEDGYAFRGDYDDGWKRVDNDALEAGDRVTPNQVLYSIVPSAPKWVRAQIDESLAPSLEVGARATLIPTAAVELELPAEIVSISPIVDQGKVRVILKALTRHEKLFPGNTCRVRFPGQ